MSSLRNRLFAVCAVAAVVFTTAAGTSAAGRGDNDAEKVDVSLELVGQTGGVPTGHAIQYGYVAHLHGLPIFSAGDENESTARLTFYTDTFTRRIINNGPLRIISREGTVTVYHDPSANGSFVNPDSFRNGTPVLVASLRQQVIVNTLSGAFTALNVNRITSTTPFQIGGEEVRLGKVGQQFRTFLSGQNNASPPPGAHMAGYTIPGNDRQGRDDD
jgi:hypothetical protein